MKKPKFSFKKLGKPFKSLQSIKNRKNFIFGKMTLTRTIAEKIYKEKLTLIYFQTKMRVKFSITCKNQQKLLKRSMKRYMRIFGITE